MFDTAALTTAGIVVDTSTAYVTPITGVLTPIGYVSLGGAESTLSAEATLDASGVVIDSGTVWVNGQATLDVTGVEDLHTTADVAAGATLYADGYVTTYADAEQFDGYATLQATGVVNLYAGSQPLIVTATVDTEAHVVDEAEESLVVEAGITADGYVIRVVSSTPTATVTLTAVATVKRPTYVWTGAEYVSANQIWVKSVGEWIQPISVWNKTDDGWRKVWAGD